MPDELWPPGTRLCRGVVLLNAAGRFDDSALAAPEAESRDEEEESLWRVAVERVAGALKRGVVFASFVFAKQPLRIRQVLGQVRWTILSLALAQAHACGHAVSHTGHHHGTASIG